MRFILILGLFLGTNVFAQNSNNKDKCKDIKEEKIAKGVVASVGNYSEEGTVPSDSSSATPGEDPSVIVGSIQTVDTSKCKAVITNNSECKTYSVSFVVKGTKQGESTTRRIVSASANLRPKGSKEQTFSCDKIQYNYAVELTSVK